MTRTELEIELADMFDDAISDSIDMDWRTIDGARACVAALFADTELLNALVDMVLTADREMITALADILKDTHPNNKESNND